MTTRSDEQLAYAALARQSARVDRQLAAALVPRLAELAPGRSAVTVSLDFRLDGSARPWVRGRAEQVVVAGCHRCLERFERRIAVAFDLCIVREGDEASAVAAGADVMVAAGETVTVAEIVEDELLLCLPERLCEADPCRFAPALSYPADDVADADETDRPFGVLAELKRADS